MGNRSKRMKEIDRMIDPDKIYSLDEAVRLPKECPPTKFDQSLNIALKLGVDVKKSDQQVRGTVFLPHGTGRTTTVLVITRGDKVKEALDAGADFAGSDEYLDKIKSGWTDFSVLVATPDMMREIGKLGKVLGPRNLMPTPKAGTVTPDVAKAVREAKAGKIEFKVDKTGNINAAVGKLSFEPSQLSENVIALLQAIVRAKPPTAKGVFLRSMYVSSTMGPGLRVDLQSLALG